MNPEMEVSNSETELTLPWLPLEEVLSLIPFEMVLPSSSELSSLVNEISSFEWPKCEFVSNDFLLGIVCIVPPFRVFPSFRIACLDWYERRPATFLAQISAMALVSG